MPSFTYVARSGDGRIQRGALEASSPGALRTTLLNRGMRLMSFEEEAEKLSTWDQLARYINPWEWLPPRSLDIEVALEQIAVMLRSGIGLLTALRTVAEQAQVTAMRRICLELAADIEEGSSFADALASQKRMPTIVVQLVRVGEATGNLDMVLESAAKHIAQRRQNVTQLITALAYPLFVGVAAIAVAVYLVVYVIPQLAKFLKALGKKLPSMTQSLVDLAGWIQVNGLTVLVILVMCTIAGILFYMWPPGRMLIDRYSLRIPLIGNVLRLSGTVTFSGALSIMLRSGITLIDALRTIEQLHNNRFLALQVQNARDAVIQGEGLARSLKTRHAFMPMLASMVAVAENAGELDDVLDRVAKFHENQLQAAIKRLSALIEPAIIVVVGGIVGYVYMAFFIALFSAGGKFQ